MPRPSLQILLAIVLVLAGSYYWDPNTAAVPDPRTSARQQALPRTYLEAPRSWTYSEEGSLAEVLEAVSAEQYPQRDETLIVAPRFYAHSSDDRTWTATADRGRFRDNAQRLTLKGNVALSHDQTGARLETAVMVIEIDRKIARSNKPVTLTYGENITTADGMVARLEPETIKLAPNVESIYVQSRP
jgi:lipopolysaccharide export system protein LptC